MFNSHQNSMEKGEYYIFVPFYGNLTMGNNSEANQPDFQRLNYPLMPLNFSQNFYDQQGNIYTPYNFECPPQQLAIQTQQQSISRRQVPNTVRYQSRQDRILSAQVNESSRNLQENKDNRDPEFKPKKKKNDQRIYQAPGRNKRSNVYRAFVKLISSKHYRPVLNKKYTNIKELHGLSGTFSDFTENILPNLPTFTNYINRSQFMRIYQGQKPQNKVFRCLFHEFINKQGYCHMLSLTYKKKMKEQTIRDFLQALKIMLHEDEQLIVS